MSKTMQQKKTTAFRNRTNPVKKWYRRDEMALINYLKENREFELPISRIYYNKFLNEFEMDTNWKNVRAKVRNMRTAYRKAKEFELNQMESNDFNTEALRREVIKICWFVEDFDVIFPNEMDNHIYRKPEVSNFEDVFSNQESSLDVTNTNTPPKSKFLLEDEISSSSSSKSGDDDIITVQHNLFNLKRQKRDKERNLKQEELDFQKEKLSFEKDKFRQEVRLREREIESQEKLKIMELQMKERIAMKELELKEKLTLKSIDKQETSYNGVYHNLP